MSVRNEIAKNLLFYRKKHKLTQKELADMLGVKNSAVSNWEKGQNSIDIETLTKACDIFKITLNDIYGKYKTDKPKTELPLTPAAHRIGKAYEKAPVREQKIVEQVLEPYIDAPPPHKPSAKNEITTTYVSVILYNQSATAGIGNYLNDDEYTKIKIEESLVPYGTDFAVRIKGDSMEPEIPDGAIVFVESTPVIRDGEVGIFILDGDSYCKRLEINHNKKQVKLVSDNAEYKDIIVSPNSALHTIGRVIGYKENS